MTSYMVLVWGSLDLLGHSPAGMGSFNKEWRTSTAKPGSKDEKKVFFASSQRRSAKELSISYGWVFVVNVSYKVSAI